MIIPYHLPIVLQIVTLENELALPGAFEISYS